MQSVLRYAIKKINPLRCDNDLTIEVKMSSIRAVGVTFARWNLRGHVLLCYLQGWVVLWTHWAHPLTVLGQSRPLHDAVSS